jgi:hypothetical protein
MSWSDAEAERVEDIETTIVDLLQVFENLASRKQVEQLLLIKQKEVEQLQSRLVEVTSDILALEESNL